MRLTEKNFKVHGNGHYFMLTGFPPQSSIDTISELVDSKQYGIKITYEICPSTQRRHIHVFLYCLRRKSWKAARDWLQLKFNCQGEVQQLKTLIHAQRAFAYIGKEYTRVQEPSFLGCPIPEIIQMNGNDGSDNESDEEEEIKDCVVTILYGVPHTGKTYRARKEMGQYCKSKNIKESIFVMQGKNHNQSGRWPGGYQQEPCVLIDEWSKKDFSKDFAKMLTERHPTTLASGQGGKSVKWNPQRIYICSNNTKEVKEFWSDPCFNGRVHHIHEMTKIYKETLQEPEWTTDESIEENFQKNFKLSENPVTILFDIFDEISEPQIPINSALEEN